MVVLSASSALFLFINPLWRTSLGYEGIIATVFFVVPTLLLGWIISWLQQANNYFIRILEHAPIGMAANALDGHFMLVNQAFCDMLGYTKEELYKLNFQDVTFPEDKNLTMTVRQQLLNGELDTYQIEKRYIRKDGQVVFGLVTSSIEKNGPDGRPFFIGQVENITERKGAEKSLQESEERYRLLFDMTIDGVLLTIPDGQILAANPAACAMFQRTEEEIFQVGRNGLVDMSDPRLAVAIEERNRTGEFTGELLFIRKDGTKFPGEFTSSLFTDREGRPRTSMVIRDVTERKYMEEQIYRLAFYDSLTNLPNRRLLNDRLNQSMAASKRSGHYGALMFLDLDNFKSLNDTHGHGAGDLLLTEVAERLKLCVREIDTVARFGGDEFVVILNELDESKAKSREQAGNIAEKIRVSLAEPYQLKTHAGKSAEAIVEHQCTSSIGVVLFLNHGASQEDLHKWADMAMYQAKAAGRNQIKFHES